MNKTFFSHIPAYLPPLFGLLFLAAAAVTGIFWSCGSDSGGFDESAERVAAKVINDRFKDGDMVFPIPEWDIGFTRYLRHGITDISYTLDAYDARSLAYMNSSEKSVMFFFLAVPDTWESIRETYDLVELKRFQTGTSVVITARPERPPIQRDVDLARGIMDAEAVFLSRPEQRHDCRKGAGKWVCSRHDWNYVGGINALVNGMKQYVVWAHPRSDRTLNIVYRNTEQSTKLFLRTAFLQSAYRNSDGYPVKVMVKADDREILSYFNENVRTPYLHEVSVPPGTERITLGIWVKHDGARHFVYNGFLGK